MTTVTIDDAPATRLRALCDKDGALDALVADALAETVHLWEREARGRAEMQAILDGPRHTLAESDARMRLKYDIPSPSHMTREVWEAETKRTIAKMTPDVRETSSVLPPPQPDLQPPADE